MWGKSSLSELVIVIFFFREEQIFELNKNVRVSESVPDLEVATVETICIYCWKLCSNEGTEGEQIYDRTVQRTRTHVVMKLSQFTME